MIDTIRPHYWQMAARHEYTIGGREGGREGWREEGREGGREGGRDYGGRERGSD